MSSIWTRVRDAADTDIPRGDTQRLAERLVWGAAVRWRAVGQDGRQTVRYGARAPRLFESVRVDPRLVSAWLSLGEPLSRGSGLVVGGSWHGAARPIETNDTLAYARLRFVDGLAWDAIYEQLVVGRGTPRPELMAVVRLGDPRPEVRAAARRRLVWFDALFEEISRSRRLEPRQNVAAWRFREHGGICVHVGPSGQPIFGARGNHRFAIARILELPTMPAVVGLVHRDAVDRWRDALVAAA